MDDILIAGRDREHHYHILEAVIKRATEFNLRLRNSNKLAALTVVLTLHGEIEGYNRDVIQHENVGGWDIIQLLTGYADNKKFIVPQDSSYFMKQSQGKQLLWSRTINLLLSEQSVTCNGCFIIPKKTLFVIDAEFLDDKQIRVIKLCIQCGDLIDQRSSEFKKEGNRFLLMNGFDEYSPWADSMNTISNQIKKHIYAGAFQ